MKKKIIVLLCIGICLAVAFFSGPKAPEAPISEEASLPEEILPTPSPVAPTPAVTEQPQKEAPKKEEVKEEPKAEEKVPSEPDVKENVCTIAVNCRTILKNMSRLPEEKRSLIPEDGMILSPKEVKFNEGENAFNVLQRELKRAKIHLEFESTPIYGSIYIEGINNIYEFDCGEGTGWMYKVNNEFKSQGCNQHILKSGDVVEWVYTCDFGKDIGGDYGAQRQ